MLIEILTPLITERLGNRLWVLLAPFKFSVDGQEYEIPPGFVFDGNSSPRFLWALCSPVGGVYGEAGPIHDWFYSLDCLHLISQRQADQIHQAIGVMRGAGQIRAKLVYAGIKAGGGRSFKICHSIEKLSSISCYDLCYARDRVIDLKNGDIKV